MSYVLDGVIAAVAAGARGGDPRGLHAGSTFAELRLDSMAALELFLALEGQFGVELDARDMLDAGALTTLGALAAYIDFRIGK